MLDYQVELQPDNNETLLVTCPDIPMVITFGETEEAALRHAGDAIEVAISTLMTDRDDIPLPSYSPTSTSRTVRLSLQTSLKAELYSALRKAGLTRSDLQRRLGWNRESVDRLFRIDHNSRMEQLEQAFAAIGKTLKVEVLEAA